MFVEKLAEDSWPVARRRTSAEMMATTAMTAISDIATASRIMRPTVIEFDSFDFSPFDSSNKKFGSTLWLKKQGPRD